MRTVTFADPRVVDLVNERYIAVWNNHNPDRAQKGTQAPFDPAEVAAYPEGGGGDNLHTVIAAADGRVLSRFAGYWSVETMLEELEFARTLTRESASERQGRRERALLEEAARLEREHPAEQGKRVRESAVLRRQAALRLLARDRRSPTLCVVEDVLAQLARNARGRVFS